ncbi:BTB/POZ domain protein, partial [Cooperia oncophora]
MGSVNHLNLLREEHLELLNKYGDLQQKYAALQSKVDPDQVPDSSTLAGQLCATMKNLYENHAFSDIVIRVGGRELKCHKFLLVARSNHWNDLESTDFIEIPDTSSKAFEVVYRWMYTDSLPRSQLDIDLLQEVCQIAFRFHFSSLQTRCVQLLKIRVDVKNCISLFDFADIEGVVELRDYCCAIIAAHWSEFKPQQFSHLSAPSLFRLLKRNSPHVLHSIVQLNREDVLLLYFIENDSKIHTVVNAADEKGLCALELALTLGHHDIASQLLKKNADCNFTDESGRSVLMRMIEKGRKTDFTPLHYVACSAVNQTKMAEWVDPLLEGMNINATDAQGRTALLLSVVVGNIALTKILLKHGADVLKADDEGKSPLSVALYDRNDTELSREIVNCGGVTAVNHSIDGVSLLHIAVKSGDIEIVRFLLENGAAIDTVNSAGETPLEVAVRQNNVTLVSLLLEKGALVRMPSSGRNSVLHKAIASGPEMLTVFAKEALKVWIGQPVDSLSYALDERLLDCAKILVTGILQEPWFSGFPIRDSQGRSCLEMSAFYGLLETLRTICGLGVNINQRTNGGFGYTVLKHALSEAAFGKCAILSFFQDTMSVLRYCGCNGDAVRISREPDTEKEEAPIHRAVSSKMTALVSALVKAKANLAVQDQQGRTACHLAVQQHNADALLEMLKANDVEFLSLRDKMGQTPFSQALFSKEHA